VKGPENNKVWYMKNFLNNNKLIPAGIFPVSVNFNETKNKWNKVPAVGKGVSWQTYQASAEELEAASHIGAMIPNGVLVFDLDISETVTLTDLQDSIEEALDAEMEIDWPLAYIHTTISGGAHYAFKIPNGLSIAQRTNCLKVIGFDLRVAGKGWICSGDGYDNDGSDYADAVSALYYTDLPSLPDVTIAKLQTQIQVSEDADDALMMMVNNNTLGLSDAEISDYMDRLPAHYADDQDTWFRVGMALNHETSGSDFGWELFDTFSQQTSGDNYDEDKNRNRWNSFGNDKNSTLTFASIIKWIKDEVTVEVKASLKNDIHRSRAADAIASATFLVKEKLYFELECDLDIAHLIISSSFWQPKEGKLHTINTDDLTVMLSEKDTIRMLVKMFGNPIKNYDILCDALELAASDDEVKLTKTDQNALKNAVINELFDVIKIHNQRTALKMDVDMFAKRTSFEFDSSHAIEHYKHIPLVANCAPKHDVEALADYKRHFPEIDEVLEFLVAARFADNRKKAYLWLKAPSDWGKDFFRVALGSIATEMSVKEVEKAMEGAPVGKSPTDFLRSMVMVTNEFKNVKSELKQLEDSITLSAKYQLETQVPLYTKLFMSAESVDSLVGEYGIEAQFANRFSLITGEGDIAQLPGFRRLGPLFIDVVKTYVTEFMNKEIARYQLLGVNGSKVEAAKAVAGFHKVHGISNKTATIEDSLPDLVAIIKHAISRNHNLNIVDHDGYKYLKSAKTAIENILFSGDIISKSEAYTLKYKVGDICTLLSADGQGVHSYKLNGKSVKAIKLSPNTDDFTKIDEDF